MIKLPEVMTLADFAVDNNTEIPTTLSNQIVIQAQISDSDYVPVGAIKTFDVIQNRKIIRTEIENDDGTYETFLAPGPTEIIINIQRVVYDGLSITEAFGQNIRAIQSQKRPFNIQTIAPVREVIDVNFNQTITTTYHNCWFTNISTPIRADDYIILESAIVWCERISTQRT